MNVFPKIHSIYIAARAGELMMPISRAEVIAGEGIVGDRYAQGLGAFSQTKPKIRHISLIALSGIENANAQLHAKQQTLFGEGDTRRNFVIKGISEEGLNVLVGRIFYLGGIPFKGTELCEPCQRPANLLKRPDFMNAFENRGGLRAEALDSGTIRNGDSLTYSSDQ